MKKINLKKKLSLNKKRLSELSDVQMAHFLGGRMAAATGYTAGPGDCSLGQTACCSLQITACCG